MGSVSFSREFKTEFEVSHDEVVIRQTDEFGEGSVCVFSADRWREITERICSELDIEEEARYCESLKKAE